MKGTWYCCVCGMYTKYYKDIELTYGNIEKQKSEMSIKEKMEFIAST